MTGRKISSEAELQQPETITADPNTMKIFQFHFSEDNSRYWVYAPTIKDAIDKMVECEYMTREDTYTTTEMPRDEWKNHNVINYAFDSEKYADACDVPESEWREGMPPQETFEEAVKDMTITEVLCSTEFDGI